MSKEPLTGTANVVYQELKISLAKAEASVASLRARVAEYEGRLKQLRDSARLMPQVEAELAQLNRDYEVNKKNYEALVARRESAEISGDMEKATGVADFRLVDPPQVSPKPVSPKRLLLLPLILVAALFAGAGASFAATRIWPTFFDISSLREVCGVPVLGSVTFHENEMDKRSARYRTIGFLSAVGALIGGYFAAILLVFILSSRAG